MADLDENYIQAVVANTALPAQTRVNEIVIHFTNAGWHCTQVAGNVVSFAARKKFRWIWFLFLWLLAGALSLIGMTFLVVLPFLYLLYYFITANKARTIVLT